MSTEPPTQHADTLAARFERMVNQRLKLAFASLKQAPFEVLTGVLMALSGVVLIEMDSHRMMEPWLRTLFVCIPLLGMLFATSILRHFKIISTPSHLALSSLYTVLAASYAYLRFNPDIYSTELWRWTTICLGVIAGAALVPLIIKRTPAHKARTLFWNLNTQIISHIILSSAFLGALTLGLTVALLAMHELLGVKISSDTYAEVLLFFLVGALPWQVTTILPNLVEDYRPQAESFRQLGTILCTYLFLPLMSIYLIILYLYQGKVLLSGFSDAPKNMMSPLVLAAAAMLLVGMLLADQLKAPPEAKEETDGVFLTVMPKLPLVFLPLMPMSLWAVGIRIEQYGWTEFRYLRLLLIIALSIIFIMGTVQHARKKPQPLIAIIATFGALSILASFGPLSAQSVSQRSQIARLKQHLIDDNAWDNATQKVITANREHTPGKGTMEPVKISPEARETIHYLAENFGAQPFETLVSPAQFKRLEEDANERGLHQSGALRALELTAVDSSSKTEAAESSQALRFGSAHHLFAPQAGYIEPISIYLSRTQSHSAPVYIPLKGELGSKSKSMKLILSNKPNQITLDFGDNGSHMKQQLDLQPIVTHLIENKDNFNRKNLNQKLDSHLRDMTFTVEGFPTFTLSIAELRLHKKPNDKRWYISYFRATLVEHVNTTQ